MNGMDGRAGRQVTDTMALEGCSLARDDSA
jgi:hypothetical protein